MRQEQGWMLEQVVRGLPEKSNAGAGWLHPAVKENSLFHARPQAAG